MLNEMLGITDCPVCGRDFYHAPHHYYWCPLCGDSDTRALEQQINILNNRLTIIENYVVWQPVITDLEDG